MVHLNRKALFYVRLLFLLMLVMFLVIDLISAIYSPEKIFIQLHYSERVSAYYSFFTTQTNYLVTFYLGYYLYTSYFRKAEPNFYFRLAVVVYITVTMLVFWLGIFTLTDDAEGSYTLYGWFSTIILHMIVPVVMIISFCFTSGERPYLLKQHHKMHLWIIAIYPVCYAIFVVIRGHLRYLDYVQSGDGHVPDPITWYPYSFLNYRENPHGLLLLLAGAVTIFLLVFGLQYLYLWVNNALYYRRQRVIQQSQDVVNIFRNLDQS